MPEGKLSKTTVSNSTGSPNRPQAPNEDRTSQGSTPPQETLVRARGQLKSPLVAGEGPLSKVPAPAAFLVVLAVFTLGVVVGGIGGALLLGFLAFGMLVMLAGCWEVLSRSDRVLRIGVLALVVGIAVAQLL